MAYIISLSPSLSLRPSVPPSLLPSETLPPSLGALLSSLPLHWHRPIAGRTRL